MSNPAGPGRTCARAWRICARAWRNCARAWRICARAWRTCARAWRTCARAWRTCARAWRTCARAWRTCARAWRTCARAWRICARAWRTCARAWRTCARAWRTCARAVAHLHRGRGVNAEPVRSGATARLIRDVAGRAGESLELDVVDAQAVVGDVRAGQQGTPHHHAQVVHLAVAVIAVLAHQAGAVAAGHERTACRDGPAVGPSRAAVLGRHQGGCRAVAGLHAL